MKSELRSALPTLHQRVLPVAAVLGVTALVWYLGCIALNAQGAIERVLSNR